MKYQSLSPLAAIAAIMQALAIYSYDQDGMAVSGQIFFPVLFTLMALYLMVKNPGGSTKQLVLAALALVVFALTMVGMSQRIPSLYPSIIVYYAAFAVLALEVGVRIAEMPKKSKVQDAEDSADDDSSDAADRDSSDSEASDHTREESRPREAARGAVRASRRGRPQRGTRLVAKVKPCEGSAEQVNKDSTKTTEKDSD